VFFKYTLFIVGDKMLEHFSLMTSFPLWLDMYKKRWPLYNLTYYFLNNKHAKKTQTKLITPVKQFQFSEHSQEFHTMVKVVKATNITKPKKFSEVL